MGRSSAPLESRDPSAAGRSQSCSLGLSSGWLAAQLCIPNPAFCTEMGKHKPSSSESLFRSQFIHYNEGLMNGGWRRALWRHQLCSSPFQSWHLWRTDQSTWDCIPVICYWFWSFVRMGPKMGTHTHKHCAPVWHKRAGGSTGCGVSTPMGKFCTLEGVPSLEGNGTMPNHPPVFIERRWWGCSVVKNGQDRGDVAWAKREGTWGAPCHSPPALTWPGPWCSSSKLQLHPQHRRTACFDGRIINVPQLHSCKIPRETRRV